MIPSVSIVASLVRAHVDSNPSAGKLDYSKVNLKTSVSLLITSLTITSAQDIKEKQTDDGSVMSSAGFSIHLSHLFPCSTGKHRAT